MAYALLVVEPVGQRQTRSEAEGRAVYDRMVKFSENLKARGLLTISQSLVADTAGARVRSQEGRSVVVDGPFAETKEQLAGFYLIEARDLNDAIQVASKIPPAREGSVEVRPVRELSAD